MEINSLEQLRERGKIERGDRVIFSFSGEKYIYIVLNIQEIWMCLRQVDEDKDILEDLKINIDEFLKKNLIEKILLTLWANKENARKGKDSEILIKAIEAIFKEIERQKLDKIKNRFEFLDFSK